jgi:hypothetical protein
VGHLHDGRRVVGHRQYQGPPVRSDEPAGQPATVAVDFVHRNIVPRVSHEGGAFDKNNSFYFIDELNGGSIYKYVSAAPAASNGDSYFAKGQTFVLKANGGSNSNAVGASDLGSHHDGHRFSAAEHRKCHGDHRHGTSSLDGRAAADMVGGTNYQRPEDLELQVLANGDEVLYIATTTTDEVYSLNLATNEMKLFANQRHIQLGHRCGGWQRLQQPGQPGDRCERQHLHHRRPAGRQRRHLVCAGCRPRRRGRVGQPLGLLVNSGRRADGSVLRQVQRRTSRT